MRIRASMLGTGDAAPDFALATTLGSEAPPAALSDFRGETILLVLAPPHWDPVCDELATMCSGSEYGPRPRVITENRHEIAQLFGVHETTALFLIDGSGVIRWRFVAGADALSPTSVEAAQHSDSEDRPLSVSRRDFMQAALSAAIVAAAALAPRTLRAVARTAEPRAQVARRRTSQKVTLTVNGREVVLDIEPRVTLLDALREHLGLTGTKKGCDHGQCGACTVHVNDRRALSCMTFAVMQEGARITTIEGLATGETLHPMQQAFITHDGFQCGYCTSGQIMSATAVAKEPWGPTDDDVREAMSGNICRCGAYPGIVAAVQSVRHDSTLGVSP